jgi:Uma2 family endonuclease
MTGASLNHSMIATNLARALNSRLPSHCRALRGDVKVLATGSVRYPDAVVTCSPLDGRSYVVPNPVAVFEVPLPGTASLDRLTKNAEYRTTPSIQRYIMVERSRMGATVFARDGENRNSVIVIGEVMLAPHEPGVEIPLLELYGGVDFPPPDNDD